MLGYEAKWAIHPSQIALCNEVYTPSAAEVAEATRVVEAIAQTAREGRGAVSLDGRLIDYAMYPHRLSAASGSSLDFCPFGQNFVPVRPIVLSFFQLAGCIKPNAIKPFTFC